MATKKRSHTAKQPSKSREPSLPLRIFAQASPRSIGGVSLFDVQEQISATSVVNFFSARDVVQRTVLRLKDAGFDILQVSPLTINIAGTVETYQRAFNTQLQAQERDVIRPEPDKTTATFVESPATPLPGLISTTGTAFEDVLEGVAIEEPRFFMAATVFPPMKEYWHLRVPADVSQGCNADLAHRAGITGRNIKVAMVDSGWFKHPYFIARGYRVASVVLGPGATLPLRDESGHGTGESANIFAVAPDVNLLPVKMSFVNSIGSFNAAVALAPDIITCSWGSDLPNGMLSAADQALAAAIAAAVASGITVIFSAGNGHWGFPGQHPDVISAGGAFMLPDGSLKASDYASGFTSNIYPNRRVPDLCGLVGMQPKAAYIMLPVEPGDAIDTKLQGDIHPHGDETAGNDGWAAFSGTSAAAPQLAGAAALVKQACPHLKPADVRSLLMKSARDVSDGTASSRTGGNTATEGPDTATGDGLVDAHKAVLLAKVRGMGPPQPVTPIQTTQPTHPVQPPLQPIQPISPLPPAALEITTPAPVELSSTIPRVPLSPILPQPIERPTGPMVSQVPGGMERGATTSRLTAEDVEQLEALVTGSGFRFN